MWPGLLKGFQDGGFSTVWRRPAELACDGSSSIEERLYLRQRGRAPRAALKPVKPAKITSTGAVVNFSIFDTAEFRSQIRPIQDTLQPWYFKLEISFSNCFDI